MLIVDIINFIVASLFFALACYFTPITFLWGWLEDKGIIKWSTIYVINIVLGVIIAIFLVGDEFDKYTSTNESKNYAYICTGSQSKRYHKTEDCIGLSRCSRTIEKVSVKDAKELGRTPCGYCY